MGNARPAQPRVVSIGECMIELADRPGACRLGFGGDTLNTALYLTRLGLAVDYVTVLGDDPYSDEMIAAWEVEGIGTGFVRREAGRVPGLYAIRTDEAGERRFHYWRDRAPARELLAGGHAGRVAEALDGADLVYLSGITVSILDEPQRNRLLDLLAEARRKGAWIAFDPNYRPAGWPGAEAARAWFDAFYRAATHALPAIDDERRIGPAHTIEALAERLRGLGVNEIVIKDGADGAWVGGADGLVHVPTEHAGRSIDTTAAGDSFNAGYLAGRLRGQPPADAARSGHRLAGTVVAHPGAIIPREAMPDLAGEREHG